MQMFYFENLCRGKVKMKLLSERYEVKFYSYNEGKNISHGANTPM